MRYAGGKGRIGKHIAAMLAPYVAGRRVLEPFCGGLSMTTLLQPAEASDNSEPLISLIEAVRGGWRPPATMTDAEYRALQRERDNHGDPLVAFAGFCCSWGGKWFGGLARGHKHQPDPVGTAAATLLRRVNACASVNFSHREYMDTQFTAGDVLYCDPPYAGTNHAYPVAPLDHGAFWEWARTVSRAGASIFVSEFAAPPDAIEVGSTRRSPTLACSDDRQGKAERLFTFNINPRTLTV
jgi:DNA adenine methylase